MRKSLFENSCVMRSLLALAFTLSFFSTSACSNNSAKALLLANVTKQAGVPQLSTIELSTGGVSHQYQGDAPLQGAAPQQVGVFLASSGAVHAVVSGYVGGMIVARAEVETAVRTGETTTVDVVLKAVSSVGDGGLPDGSPDGSAADVASGSGGAGAGGSAGSGGSAGAGGVAGSGGSVGSGGKGSGGSGSGGSGSGGMLAFWTSPDPMQATRVGHSATLLVNGNVLVAGGNDGIGPSAELYNATDGTWSTTASPMVKPRKYHRATVLADDRVLIAAGFGVKEAEIYDPVTKKFTGTGSLSDSRHYFAATRLPNGNVLAAGGVNSASLKSAEIYDIQTKLWSTTEPMGSVRYHHTATLLGTGKVLVAGGLDQNNVALLTAELYDPDSGKWTATGSMTAGRWAHTATLLADGNVLVAGGGGNSSNLGSAELYDTNSGKWTVVQSMKVVRASHSATLLGNGKVLAAGGRDNFSQYQATAEIFDVGSRTWTLTASMTTPHAYHTATLLTSGKLLVVGGVSGANNDHLSSAELYTPAP